MTSRRYSRQTDNSPKNRFEYWKFNVLINKHFSRLRQSKNTQNKKENESHNPYIKYGTWTDRIGIVVNIAMATITLFLFRQATRQNDISEKNIQLADSSAKAARISAIAAQRTVDYMDSTFKLTKESMTSSDSNFIQTLNLTRKSVDASIKSASLADSAFNLNKTGLNLTASFFEIDNRSIVYFDEMILNPFEVGKSISVQIGIKNYGKSPAYFRSIRTAIRFDTASFYNNFSYTPNEKKYVNLLCTQQNGIGTPVSSPIVLDTFLINVINSGFLKVYFHGELFYIDISTNKKMVYMFSMRLRPNKTFEVMNIHNGFFEVTNPRDLKLLD